MWRIHERAGLHVHTSSDVIADAVVELRLSLGRAALTTPGRVVHTMTGTVTFSMRTFSKPATALAKSLTRPAAWFNTSAPTGAFCSAEADNVRSYAAAVRFLSDAQQRRGYSGPVADAPLPPRLSPKVRAHQLWQ